MNTMSAEELEEKMFQTCNCTIAGTHTIFRSIAKKLAQIAIDYAASQSSTPAGEDVEAFPLFYIIQAACRCSMNNPTTATIHQWERFMKALSESGFDKECKSINEILHPKELTEEERNMKIVRSTEASLQNKVPVEWISIDKDADYDGEYYGYIRRIEGCGTVHEIQRVVLNRNNKWVLDTNEELLYWMPLFTTPQK